MTLFIPEVPDRLHDLSGKEIADLICPDYYVSGIPSSGQANIVKQRLRKVIAEIIEETRNHYLGSEFMNF